jgi:hypothetical protein
VDHGVAEGLLHARVCVRLLRINLRASAHRGRTSRLGSARKLGSTNTGTVELSKDLNASYGRVMIMNTADRLMTLRNWPRWCASLSPLCTGGAVGGKGHPATASAATSATDASG